MRAPPCVRNQIENQKKIIYGIIENCFRKSEKELLKSKHVFNTLHFI